MKNAIVVSSVAEKGSGNALAALQAGAVEVISKPSVSYSIDDMAVELVDKIEAAYSVNVKKLAERKALASQPKK
ncbi:MAG: hypothetical protein IT292_03290 [Deltaproteobacteria bacterium]|nr:hypothetical protein [Deltaproteobacteria bacterium]